MGVKFKHPHRKERLPVTCVLPVGWKTRGVFSVCMRSIFLGEPKVVWVRFGQFAVHGGARI